MMSPAKFHPTSALSRMIASFLEGFRSAYHREPMPVQPKPKRAYKKRVTKVVKVRAPIAAPSTPRKTDIILDMLKRPEGATVEELMCATGWQAHSVTATFAALRRASGLAITHKTTSQGKVWIAYNPRLGSPL